MTRPGLSPRLLVAAGLALGLAGCSADNSVASNPGPLVFTLGADSAWSGGTVDVTATRFAEQTYTPVFVSGTDTLPASRAGDSTYAVRIPIGPAGPVPLALQDGARRFEVGTVERAGFREVQWYTPGFDYSMQIQARRQGVPVVLGNGPAGITLAYPSLHRSERITGLRAPFDYYGIGQSYRGDEFVLRDSLGVVGRWELWPAPRQRGTWPSAARARQGTIMSPTTFLEVSRHNTQTVDTTSPARGYGPFFTEDCWNVHLSPRTDRVVLRSVSSHAGVPVINSLTADTAYTIPRMVSLGSAGFTADGAEFFAAGYYPPRDSLRRVDASTGTIQASAALPEGEGPRNLEVDPAGRFVYLHLNADCRPRIVVYDARTLAMVWDLRVPLSVDPGPCDNGAWEGMLVVDTAPDRLYVVWNGEPFPVFEFTVLP